MRKVKLIIIIMIINIFLVKSDSIQCGNHQIDNCKECGQGEDSNTCAKCEAEHFPVLENLLCFPCNDSIYNQVGCKGECDGKDYSHSGFAYCQECKEGYYNLEGICKNCEKGSPYCKECTFEKELDSENKKFKCQKCLNEEEYRMDANSICVKCNTFLNRCKKCHFIRNDGFKAECDECDNNYFIDSNKNCTLCYYQQITGGRCYICSSDLKPDYCNCDSGYVFNGTSCTKCPNNCAQCEFNNKTNSIK